MINRFHFISFSHAFLMGIAIFCLLNVPITLTSSAQDSEEDRRVWDSDFLKKRPKSNSPKKRDIRYKRTTSSAANQDSTKKDHGVTGTEEQYAVVGVTLWRLRQPDGSSDKDVARILDRVQDNPSGIEWVAERINTDTPLAIGQRIRLTVEVPRSGYLYLIDREQYADGTFSEPYLVFPRKRARGLENNEVRAGLPVEFPSLEDQHPYFILARSRPDHIGEAITLLVTPTPIPGLNIGTNNLKLSQEQVEKWESQWSTSVEIHQLVGGEGKLYNTREKEAVAGLNLLSEDDPVPQTLYRVARNANDPIMLRVPLKVGQ
jgi:hypothetical protein